AGQLGQATLVDPEQRTGGAQLGGGDHALSCILRILGHGRAQVMCKHLNMMFEASTIADAWQAWPDGRSGLPPRLTWPPRRLTHVRHSQLAEAKGRPRWRRATYSRPCGPSTTSCERCSRKWKPPPIA